MTRALYFIMGLAVLSLASGCGQPPFPQTQKLDEQTQVVLVDAWIIDHMPQLFEVVLEYQGANPAGAYNVRGYLCADAGGRGMRSVWRKAVPTANAAGAAPRLMGEFLRIPGKEQTFFQMEFTDKKTGQSVQSLRFKLPRRFRVQRMN